MVGGFNFLNGESIQNKHRPDHLRVEQKRNTVLTAHTFLETHTLSLLKL